MPCGCKHKRGSGRAQFLSGVTWHGYKKGSGRVFSGGGIYKKRRKKRGRGYYNEKTGRGMGMTGGGINLSGGGANFSGGALRWVVNKKRNGRKVI